MGAVQSCVQGIQTKLSGGYHEQAVYLLAVEKWHFRFAYRTRDLENEPRSVWPKMTELIGPIAELLLEKRYTSCKAICGRPKIPRVTSLPVLNGELRLT
jgi:hypothetical protein